MNPIKTPRQMLFDQTGIPHLGEGGSVPKLSPHGEKLFAKLSKKLSRVLGRAPTSEELLQLHHEIHGMTPKQYADGGSVLGGVLGHGLNLYGAVPEAIAAGRQALAGQYGPAASHAIEAASSFLPPQLTALYLGLAPTTLGDDTIAGWNASEAARKQKSNNQ